MMRRTTPRLTGLMLTLLVIEFIDEFIYGAREAAWPLIRDDLSLSYIQVGVLLSAPNLVANVVEPFFGILGDVWRRRALILGGGVVFAAALALTAVSNSFSLILAAFILFHPASGAFVSLSQATLMDANPDRHEHNMARWTLAGSIGVVTGALALGAGAAAGIGWRWVFVATAAATVVAVVAAARMPLDGASGPRRTEPFMAAFRRGLMDALRTFKRLPVLRWLILLEFSDLMLDGLHGYLALYFVDVVGAGEAKAALGVAVWTGVGLVGDVLLIPLLERVRGLTYLRFSVVAELVLFPTFLLVPGLGPKLVIVALLGFANAGWYSILQGQLYSAMPGQSGTALAVKNISGLAGSLMPLGIGAAARAWGLGTALWLMLAGPIVLLVGMPRRSEETAAS